MIPRYRYFFYKTAWLTGKRPQNFYCTTKEKFPKGEKYKYSKGLRIILEKGRMWNNKAAKNHLFTVDGFSP
jgi:hypothetical protein